MPKYANSSGTIDAFHKRWLALLNADRPGPEETGPLPSKVAQNLAAGGSPSAGLSLAETRGTRSRRGESPAKPHRPPERRPCRCRPRPPPGPHPPTPRPWKRPGPGTARRGRRTPGAGPRGPPTCRRRAARPAGQSRAEQGRAGPLSLPSPASERTHAPTHPSIPRAGPPATGGSGRSAVQEQAHLSPRRPPAGQEEGGDRRTRLRDERGQRLPDSTRRLTSCVPHSCCPAPDIIPPPLPAPCRDALPLLRPEAPLAPPWRFPTYLLHPPAAASPVTRRTKEAGAAPGWKRRGRAWAGGAGRPASAGARGRRAAKSHGVSRQRAS